jgi:hypothetical protein
MRAHVATFAGWPMPSQFVHVRPQAHKKNHLKLIVFFVVEKD